MVCAIVLTACIVCAVYVSVVVNLWDALAHIPFYTVNAWAMWLTALNTVLLLAVLKSSQEKPVQVILTVTGTEQEAPIKVEQEQPKLTMESLPHA